MVTSTVIVLVLTAWSVRAVVVDLVDCGIDHSLDVSVGDVDVEQYPWVGILYYTNFGNSGESRAVTSVLLIHEEFVIAAAADVGPMPKHNFRANSRVLLGDSWLNGEKRRVRNYVMHPEYEETYNTVALVQLADPVRLAHIKPLCPPPDVLRNPTFYVVKFKEDYNKLRKHVIPVSYVPGDMCRDFYVSANLYAKKLRPPHVACAVSTEQEQPCVWEAGSALVSRDVWGRWQLLGLGVRGPGCGAPARFLDMMSYYPWVENSLNKFQRLTISKISNQKYVLRSGDAFRAFQRFGACDEEEILQHKLLYRDAILLRTDNQMYQFMNYNLTIVQNVEYSCLTLELVNASANSEMRIRHRCPRESWGPVCHAFRDSVFDIAVSLIFSDKCIFELTAWGSVKNMTLLDIQEWKWEEGTYYEDFSMTRVEYRGTRDETEFGFEPLDERLWVPEYDIWTTTAFDNSTTTTEYLPPKEDGGDSSPADARVVAGGTTLKPFSDVSSEDSEFVIGIKWK